MVARGLALCSCQHPNSAIVDMVTYPLVYSINTLLLWVEIYQEKPFQKLRRVLSISSCFSLLPDF